VVLVASERAPDAGAGGLVRRLYEGYDDLQYKRLDAPWLPYFELKKRNALLELRDEQITS
jgi:hypothetical protein